MMSTFTVVWLVFAAVGTLLAVLAYLSSRHTHSASDFLIASRRLPAWSGGISYALSGINVRILLLVSGAAFAWGLPALWMAAGLWLGTLINVCYVAGRLRSVALAQNALTLGEVLSIDVGDRLQPSIARSILAIVLVTLIIQASALLKFVADYAAIELGFDGAQLAIVGLIVVVGCCLVGGLRAVALCDVAQGALVLGVAALLAIGGLVSQGGWIEFWAAFDIAAEQGNDLFAGKHGVLALALSSGFAGLGFAVLGQPQALTRFIALRDERTLAHSRSLAILISLVLLACMCLGGWVARVLYTGLQHPEHALFALAMRPLPPSIGAAMSAVLLAAVILAAAAPLFNIASACAVELKSPRTQLSAAWTRVAFIVAALISLLVASWMPLHTTEHLLFAFSAVGAAIGPVLLVRLSGKRIRPATQLGAIWAGFLLTWIFYLLPDSPGDFLQRVFPFVTALGIALTGGERRRNPDRADRSQQAVHDRVPI